MTHRETPATDTVNRTYRYRLNPNAGQRRSLGQMLAVHRELYNAAQHEGPAVGVDVGLRSLVALSNGETVVAPKRLHRSLAKLRRQQRRVARRKRGSGGWREARRQVAKTQARIADQRRDFHHKLSRELVDRFSLIAIEDLNVKGLARSRLARPIHDAAWSTLAHMLEYKAESAGSRVVRVDPRGTSQTCSGCGTIVPKGLEVRVHRCGDCGLELDRDVNAARNVLRLATSPPERGGCPPTWPEAGASVGQEAA